MVILIHFSECSLVFHQLLMISAACFHGFQWILHGFCTAVEESVALSRFSGFLSKFERLQEEVWKSVRSVAEVERRRREVGGIR